MFFLIALGFIAGFLRWVLAAWIILFNVLDAFTNGPVVWQAVWIAVAVLIATFRWTFTFEDQPAGSLARREYKVTL